MGPIQPQLATPALVPPDGDRWLHEVKHDGYRIIAVVEGGRARLWSRKGTDYSKRATAVAAAVAALADDVMLDGELVVLRPDGTTDFEALQATLRRARPGLDLAYMVWDLLRLRGEWLFRRPLLERKERLAKLLQGHIGPIRYVDHIIGHGPAVYLLACELRAEGIVSKRVDSVYRPGRRAQTWLKSKCWEETTFLVGGYSTQATEQYPHGALLLGREDDEGRLQYAGQVSLGWSDRQASAVTDRLAPALRPTSPFTVPPARGACWTEPAFVARVRYLESTRSGQLRHATLKELAPRETP